MKSTELSTVKEEAREVNHMTSSRLLDSLFSKDLAPHYMKLAGQLSASEIVPKCYRNKPSDLFLCWAKGYQLGISPEQAMDCISVINGKAVMWGDEMLALCMSHPDFIDINEEPIANGANTVIGYRCTIKRKHRSDTVSEFTLDMAKKAGLLAKGGVWNQYPERMLKLRARGFALRDAFPDALKGIKSREEVEDYIDADYTVGSKSSRTELLKKDLLDKQGVSNVDLVDGSAPTNEHKVSIETAPENEESGEAKDDSQQAAELHIEIKKLIDEKSFAPDRLTKALEYYQVKSIEDMEWEASHHFLIKLKQL